MRLPRSFLSLAMTILLFLISISAYGQSYQSFRSELDLIARRTKLKIGPFRIFPSFNIRNIGYDGNVNYQRKEENPTSDFTGTVSPELKVYFLFRNYLILSLTENPEYVYYSRHKRERRFNNTLSPELKFLFINRLVISGKYSFNNRRWRPSIEFDQRVNLKIQIFNGRLFYETPRITLLGFSWSITRFSYEDVTLPGVEIGISRALDRKERSGHFEFYYRVFSESFFFIKGGYTEYKFEHLQVGWRDSSSYQVYSGIRFPILGRIRGTLSLGYKKFIPMLEEKKGFTGLVGNTSLNFRLARFIFRLNYNRDVHFSYWTDSIFFNEDRYGAGISFYLTKFLRIDYNLNYTEANYPESTVLQMPDGSYEEIKRKDIHRAHIVGFVFRIIKNTGLGIMVNLWERESNYYWENRERMFVGGYITYEF